ncbi:Bacterial alpha-L-rhamnosidase [Paenibacillus konkukensis]|uniref:alpha-L-rhamnosidase n=1 Tax=Paenibacillus konkukensis TaxID=2020716 RepID=A0ABY4RJN0_9BACL|nr:family 78 glycoside hydrolase catalytic domain [Paenibacillus konkukensis]UQZ82677.1 Bacterial alpha-L-rhamnosidase [Paenibacillus konkukensis]
MSKQWIAQWIQDPIFSGVKPLPMLHKELDTVENRHPDALKNRHTLFRKTFTLTDAPKQAELNISADDYYKLYINGVFVAQGPAQSYPTHYFYNRLDIAAYLRTGTNVIAVHVYYQGLVNRSMNSGDLRQGLIAEVYTDRRLCLITDDSWTCTAAKEYIGEETVGYDTQYLENIDSRLEHKGWTAAEYDDADWERPALAAAADHQLELQPTPALSVYERRPQSVQRLSAGRYVIDFGTELTGQFTMRACGGSGERIVIRCGEELNPDGDGVRYELRCNCKYEEVWTLSGGEDVLSFYEYKAFRYVEVLGSEEAIDEDSFAAVVRHYPLDESSCRFSSSDPVLDQIWSICANGVKYGAQENFVDCPSREKGQYLGDNTVIGHTHMYLSGDARLVKKALEDFARSTAVCSGMMAVAPGNFMQEIADFSLQWPMQLWQYYRHTGDLAFLMEMAPVGEKLVAYFDKYKDHTGLLYHVAEKWNLVDWPDNLRDGYDFPLTRPVTEGCHNVVNAYYYGCKKTMNEIRKELGLPEEDLAPLKDAFLAAFYDAEAGLFVDAVGSRHSSLHANVLPLLFGLAERESVPNIVRLIRDKRFSCGVYFSYFVLKALAEAGEYALMYDLIRGEDEHSWVNMLREGATTCFEAWGKDQKWNTSLCHPWASSPIPLLIEEIIGLKPHKPGWEEIRFNPQIPPQLTELQLSLTLPSGTVRIFVVKGQADIEASPGIRIIT